MSTSPWSRHSFALGTAAGNWGSRVPDVKADLDLSEGAIGAGLLVLSIGAVAGSWVGGWIVRQVGTKVVVRTSWFVLGGVLILPGFASSWFALARGCWPSASPSACSTCR